MNGERTPHREGIEDNHDLYAAALGELIITIKNCDKDAHLPWLLDQLKSEIRVYSHNIFGSNTPKGISPLQELALSLEHYADTAIDISTKQKAYAMAAELLRLAMHLSDQTHPPTKKSAKEKESAKITGTDQNIEKSNNPDSETRWRLLIGKLCTLKTADAYIAALENIQNVIQYKGEKSPKLSSDQVSLWTNTARDFIDTHPVAGDRYLNKIKQYAGRPMNEVVQKILLNCGAMNSTAVKVNIKVLSDVFARRPETADGKSLQPPTTSLI